jgi:hypothetical protein
MKKERNIKLSEMEHYLLQLRQIKVLLYVQNINKERETKPLHLLVVGVALLENVVLMTVVGMEKPNNVYSQN